MRKTLRRSCAACAKAKHSCDLRTPKCARCLKRNSTCIYANEPLTSEISLIKNLSLTHQISQGLTSRSSPQFINELMGHSLTEVSTLSLNNAANSFDPFDSYPSTRLPRMRVQGLMQHFLSKITFQYYPLDLNPDSNPFLVWWWPLALSDPALFHVSLQTASLDDERQAQKGFAQSEILMSDSVSLVRRKIEDPSQAFEAATMNAVVTLAAIEHGKGNLEISKMHIEGVKRMISVKGGISGVKQTSPLTARMVPWVAMLVMGSPQFPVQDEFGLGNGISPIAEWKYTAVPVSLSPGLLDLGYFGLDSTVEDIITRLRIIFGQSEASNLQNPSKILSTTDLHDLTCYTLHRLLLLTSPAESSSIPAAISECVRYGISVYMFIIHGPTYYSHAEILNSLIIQFKLQLEFFILSTGMHDPLSVWLVSVGMVASFGTGESRWFISQAKDLSTTFDLRYWKDVRTRLESVLWLETGRGAVFREEWEKILVPDASISNLEATG